MNADADQHPFNGHEIRDFESRPDHVDRAFFGSLFNDFSGQHGESAVGTMLTRAKPRRKSKTFAMDLPSVEVLRECFDLDVEAGKLFWRRRPAWHFTDSSYAQRWNDRWSGVEALTGRSGRGGPKQGTITIAGRQYHPQASRIVWTMHYGTPSKLELGHRNGDWADNRPGDLVELPSRDRILEVSMKRPGLRGAYKHRDGGYWSGITVDGQQVYLGHFDTDVEANAAWLSARAKREAQIRVASMPNPFD